MKYLAFGLMALCVAATARAESPYAGQEQREIKALTARQVDDYLNGRGSGFARAAELNRFPGPMHVLDLAAELDLSGEQRRRSEAIFSAMRSDAVALGTELVQRERELDRAFAEDRIDQRMLEVLLSEIGVLYQRLRYVHLAAHIEQRALLSEAQIDLYDRLRGYRAGHGSGHGHSH